MNPIHSALNWYTQRLPFPRRGWKFVAPLLSMTGLAKRRYIKKLFSGNLLLVDATDHIQKNVFWYGSYEPDVSRMWLNFVDEESWVIDVGANIGYFSVLAAAKAKSGRVIAFEPHPGLRERFVQNMALNRLPNYHLLPYCITDQRREVQFFHADEYNTGMSSLVPPENFSGHQETVQAISLDDWLNDENPGRIDLLKLDIEGGEKRALEGMTTVLQRFRPVIFIELFDRQMTAFGHTLTEVYNILSLHRYQGYQVIAPTVLKRITSQVELYDAVFLPQEKQLPPAIHLLDEPTGAAAGSE